MPQALSRFARLSAIAWCAAHPFADAACARKTPATTEQAPAPGHALPATLRVTNSNFSDVRIYLARGTLWLRLGLVTTNGTAEFSIPPDFLAQAASVTLVAEPVAGRTAYRTTLAGVLPGDELELVVEAFLQYSHLVVR